MSEADNLPSPEDETPEPVASLRLPDRTQRLVIVGRTGSGKTVAALWVLSLRDFDEIPWIIFDFKLDENIQRISRAVRMDVRAPVPREPGIYIVSPIDGQEEDVDDLLRRIWAAENTGVYVDEGFMIGKNSSGLRRILTQGRSKQIPMVILVQRPVWVERFVLSEADFYQFFWLNHRDDRKKMEEYFPDDKLSYDRPPPFHSFWYDVGRDEVSLLGPVEAPEISLERINRRLEAIQEDATETPKLIRL